MEETGDNKSVTLNAWDARRIVRRADASEVRFSRGFLRSKPEKWLPGFAAQWLPLAHSLGVEMKVLEVKPLIQIPSTLDIGYGAVLDNEPIALFSDPNSLAVILDALSPGATAQANQILAEYLARRFLSSLALAWSGPEASVLRFDTEIDPHDVAAAGGVKIVASINNKQCTFWLLLGRFLLERLDSLWRKQLRSTAKLQEEDLRLHLELVQLAVPPATLVEYLKSDAKIDLEIAVTDQIVLRSDSGKVWSAARLCDVGGKIGFEVLAGPVPQPILPEGTTRLSVEFGAITLEPAVVAELSQAGAMYETEIPLDSQVDITINSERVAGAALCTFEGRYAIKVNS